MYSVCYHARQEDGIDAAQALMRAVVSALRGQAAAVEVDGQRVWYAEVDTKTDGDRPDYPVIVHFCGASLEEAIADLRWHDWPNDWLGAADAERGGNLVSTRGQPV
jgi:hypothetical protein